MRLHNPAVPEDCVVELERESDDTVIVHLFEFGSHAIKYDDRCISVYQRVDNPNYPK